MCSGGKTVEADKVLISIGRTSDLQCLGALRKKLQQERNFVIADEYMRTNIPNIYAAGDITGKSMLAHSAFKMGEAAAKNAMGGSEKCLLKTVPSCVYTDVYKRQEQGVSFAFFDNINSHLDADDYASLVTTDTYGAGVEAAKILAQQLNGEGQIAMFTWATPNLGNLARSQGFRDYIEANFPNRCV